MADASAKSSESSNALVAIDIDPDLPFMIGDASIEKLEARASTFTEFVETIERSRSLSQSDETLSGGVALLRIQLEEQAVGIDTKGNKYPLTPDVMLMMPRRYATKVSRSVVSFDGVPGKILSKGDAVDAPVLYQLGTPIPIKGGEVSELEFQANTYGDLEEVLAEASDMDQALRLIERCARPIGKGIKTQPLMHSDSTKKISLADGIFVMNEILPRFLE